MGKIETIKRNTWFSRCISYWHLNDIYASCAPNLLTLFKGKSLNALFILQRVCWQWSFIVTIFSGVFNTWKHTEIGASFWIPIKIRKYSSQAQHPICNFKTILRIRLTLPLISCSDAKPGQRRKCRRGANNSTRYKLTVLQKPLLASCFQAREKR